MNQGDENMSITNRSEETCCTPQGQECNSGTETQSHCGTDESCCSVESVTEKWSSSFCEALQAVQVEILKKKIVEKWGDKMDKVGDAVIEAMEVQWRAMQSTTQSQATLRETISTVLLSEKK